MPARRPPRSHRFRTRKKQTSKSGPITIEFKTEKLRRALTRVIESFNEINPKFRDQETGDLGVVVVNKALDEETGLYYYGFVDEGRGPVQVSDSEFLTFIIDDAVIITKEVAASKPRRISRRIKARMKALLGPNLKELFTAILDGNRLPDGADINELLVVLAEYSAEVSKEVATAVLEEFDKQYRDAYSPLYNDTKRVKSPFVLANESRTTGAKLIDSFEGLGAGETIE